jgi:DNA-binding CsgD family transcriptional regulator
MPPVPDPPSGGAQCGAAAWARAVRADGLTATRILARTALLAGIGDRLYAPRLAAARALVLADDPDAATHLDALVAEARMRDVPTIVTAALTTRADLALRHGRPDAAEADLDDAEHTLARASWRIPALVRLLALRTLIAVETGRLDRAAEVAATPVPDAAVTTVAWTDLLYARGVLAVGSGRHREAVALLRECGRRWCADGWVNPAVAGWRSWAAVAYHALGETRAAGELVADEVAVARTWGAPSALGVAYLRAGRLADGDRAVSLLRDAVDVLRTAPARRRRVEAVAQLRSRMAGGDGPPGRPLSVAQRRVADLAASGFTNAAIARVLSITKRAVELHLTHAYRNLGIRGRRDLPAALRHRGGAR